MFIPHSRSSDVERSQHAFHNKERRVLLCPREIRDFDDVDDVILVWLLCAMRCLVSESDALIVVSVETLGFQGPVFEQSNAICGMEDKDILSPSLCWPVWLVMWRKVQALKTQGEGVGVVV